MDMHNGERQNAQKLHFYRYEEENASLEQPDSLEEQIQRQEKENADEDCMETPDEQEEVRENYIDLGVGEKLKNKNDRHLPNMGLKKSMTLTRYQKDSEYKDNPEETDFLFLPDNERISTNPPQKNIVVPKFKSSKTLGPTVKSKYFHDPQDEEEEDDEVKQNEVEDEEEDIVQEEVKEFGGTNHKQNMEVFVNNYGISFDFPAMYVRNAKFYPSDPSYSLQVIKYVIPPNYDVITHDRQGGVSRQKINEVYKDTIYYEQGLRLMQQEDKTLKMLKQIPIPFSKKLLIEFSPDGRYLAMYFKINNKLQIYEIRDGLFQLLDDIENEQYLSQESFKELMNTKKIKFTQNSQYLALYGYREVNIFSLEENTVSISEQFEIDKTKYKAIFDLQISEVEGTYKYRCEIACLTEEYNYIQIFDIEQRNSQELIKKTIHFTNGQDIGNLRVKISRNFENVIFANKTENYLLTRNNDSLVDSASSYNQNTISWMKGKIIREIVYAGDSHFLMVCCKEYDRDLDVQSSEYDNFKISIIRRIEPNTIFIFDVLHLNEDEGDGIGDRLMIMSLRDEDFFIDIVNPIMQQAMILEPQNYQQSDVIINEVCMAQYQAFGNHWPYLANTDLDQGYFLIFNVYNKYELIRIQIPQNLSRIVRSWIADTKDIFLMGETVDGFELHCIDLDNYQGRMEKNSSNQIFQCYRVMKYSKEHVENSDLLDMHVRGSSQKQLINLNKSIQVFFLHKNGIYQWSEDFGRKPPHIISDDNSRVFSSQFDRIDNETIFYAAEVPMKSGIKIFQFHRIKIEFSSYETDLIYEEKQDIDLIKTYGFDQSQWTLVLLKRALNKKKAQKTIKIIDLDPDLGNKVILLLKIKNKELTGRLKSKLYQLVDGHMYYNNQIIKIRYDLLRSQKISKDYEENEVFDFYENILSLQPDEKVLTQMPISQHSTHRLVYMIKNRKSLKTFRIINLPYLHERKIFLGNNNPECEYFETAQQSQIVGDDEISFFNINLTESKYYVYSQNGMLKKRVDYHEDTEQYGTPRAVSNNGCAYIFKKSGQLEINLMFLSNKRFIHVKTIKIKEEIFKFCEECKEMTSYEQVYESIKNGQFKDFYRSGKWKYYYVINDNMDVCIQISPVSTNEENKQKITTGKKSKLNLDQQIIDKLENSIHDKFHRIEHMFYFQKGYFIGSETQYNQQFIEEINVGNLKPDGIYSKLINNFSCQSTEFLQTCNIFLSTQNEYFQQGLDGISISTEDIYFWNDDKIWRYHISTPNEFHALSLVVDSADKITKIKKVRTGSKADRVAVVIRQSKQSDFCMLWNVELDNEIEFFDHGLNPNVFWGFEGDAYSTEEDRVYITSQGVVIKCFDVQSINDQEKIKTKLSRAFDLHKGQRFDSKNHSWLFLTSQISLSYSYMTFIINYKFQQLKHFKNKDYLFDKEQFDYIINKSTALHDKHLIKDSAKLAYVLHNFNMIDPYLLEQLQYYNDTEPTSLIMSQKSSKSFENSSKIVTPLHIAYQKNYNRSINIILKYLSMLEFTQFKTFKDVFPYLVEYSGFIDYLYEQTFQTQQMQQKQVLKVYQPQNQYIVKIGSSISSYVDGKYYKDNFDEDASEIGYQSFPVKVVALEIGWIINQDEGFDFLQAVCISNRIDLYDLDAIQIMIEYMHEKFKWRVVKQQFPLYIIYMVVFLATIFYNENRKLGQIQAGGKMELKSDDPSVKELNELSEDISEAIQIENDLTQNILGVLNLACTFWCFGLFIINHKEQVIKSSNRLISLNMEGKIKSIYDLMTTASWTRLDLLYCIFNAYISIMILSDDPEPDESLRRFEALTAMVLWIKLLYFLQLVDKASPLIRTLFQIVYQTRTFMYTIIIFIFAFAHAFWLLGKNQIQFDVIMSEETPIYSTFEGALQFIYVLCLGEVGEYPLFELGEQASQYRYLWVMFIGATFFLIIHMLNMLIAIMGQTFAQNGEVKDQMILKNKLRFVIDNWAVKNYAFGEERKKINYLVAALINEDDDDDIEIIKDIQEDFLEMKYTTKTRQEDIKIQLKKLRTKIAQMDN